MKRENINEANQIIKQIELIEARIEKIIDILNANGKLFAEFKTYNSSHDCVGRAEFLPEFFQEELENFIRSAQVKYNDMLKELNQKLEQL